MRHRKNNSSSCARAVENGPSRRFRAPIARSDFPTAKRTLAFPSFSLLALISRRTHKRRLNVPHSRLLKPREYPAAPSGSVLIGQKKSSYSFARLHSPGKMFRAPATPIHGSIGASDVDSGFLKNPHIVKYTVMPKEDGHCGTAKSRIKEILFGMPRREEELTGCSKERESNDPRKRVRAMQQICELFSLGEPWTVMTLAGRIPRLRAAEMRRQSQSRKNLQHRAPEMLPDVERPRGRRSCSTSRNTICWLPQRSPVHGNELETSFVRQDFRIRDWFLLLSWQLCCFTGKFGSD